MKNTMTRKFYIPSLYAPHSEKPGEYESHIASDGFAAMFFVGKQSKPAWHYRFKSRDEADAKIKKAIADLNDWKVKKAARKEESKNLKDKSIADIKIGDLFVSAWGYDQTNVDFYQVVAKKGKTFTIRDITSKSVTDSGMSFMSDFASPVKDSFAKDSTETVKRGFSHRFGYLSKTTEESKHYRSWYA